MNKKRFKKIAIAAAAFSISSNLKACDYRPPDDFDPRNNTPVAVYGPPEVIESRIDEDTDTSTDILVDTDKSTDTSTEIASLKEESSSKNSTDTDTDTDYFNPRSNLPQLVYGPPSYFEDVQSDTQPSNSDEDAVTDQYSFNPEDNVSAAVYGPPAE